jgi:hypothetical protein
MSSANKRFKFRCDIDGEVCIFMVDSILDMSFMLGKRWRFETKNLYKSGRKRYGSRSSNGNRHGNTS